MNHTTKQRIIHRPVRTEDIATICNFVETPQELYWCFPFAQYPLTESQLHQAVASRTESTVFLVDDQIAGFCNFPIMERHLCFLGNVMISKAFRGQGVGKYLVQTMCSIAFDKYHVDEFKVSCFSDNLNGLFLYSQLEFKPFDIEKRIDPFGNPIALIHFRLYREEYYRKFYKNN